MHVVVVFPPVLHLARPTPPPSLRILFPPPLLDYLVQVCLWKRSLLFLEADWLDVSLAGVPVLHGFLRSEEVTEVLRRAPVGSFLFRFSNNNPGHVAVAVHRRESGVVHSLIKVLCPGVAFQTAASSDFQYGSLRDLARAHPELASFCTGFPLTHA